MFGITHFGSFLIAGILLNLTPGNDTIFILSRSVAQGRKAGIMSALGIASGSIIHTTLAAFGISVIIARSLLLFQLMKYAGAAYLAYIGIQMLLNKSGLSNIGNDKEKNEPLLKIYRDAVFTNVLNPKVAMFFIAFLPQFVDEAHRLSPFPFLLLGLAFTTTGTVWCVSLAVFAAQVSGKLRSSPHLSSYVNKICGAVIIALSVKLALTGKK